jgi:hypothetical protein
MINIPKDVKSYMILACEELAKEQNFTPKSEEDTMKWLLDNQKKICLKAQELQWDLLNKLNKPGAMEKVGRIMSTKVWVEINKRNLYKKANESYNETLAD